MDVSRGERPDVIKEGLGPDPSPCGIVDRFMPWGKSGASLRVEKGQDHAGLSEVRIESR